jgi:Protein of unknown function (DUF4230)
MPVIVPPPPYSPNGPQPAKGKAVLLVIALALVFMIAGAGFYFTSSPNSNGSLVSRVVASLFSRGTRIDVSQPTVVRRIQQLQRLETVVYTMDKIVTGARESPVLPDFLAGDKLLMLVHGQVIAGIDFATLQAGNVSIDGKQIRVRLPEAQILTTTLDNSRTRVYSRQTGLLVPVDPNLESEVRQEAEKEIRDAALADGILKTAQQNARSTVTSMLQGLGFERVEVE